MFATNRGAPVGYNNWRDSHGGASVNEYHAWLASNGLTPQGYVELLRQPGGLPPSLINNPLTGQPYPAPPGTSNPVPGQPLPVAPAPAPAPLGPPSFAPPQVQLPAALPAREPQGLGGMPMVRDRMLASVMAPFAQPNWGVPQVNPQYLTQQMPLLGGAIPAGIVTPPPSGGPNVQIPRNPRTGPSRGYA